MSTSDDRSGMTKLPNEMIFEILSRVPGSALLRLKCVCKEWFGIIAEPGFAKAHCKKQIQNQTNHRLFCSYRHLSTSNHEKSYSVRCSRTGSEEFRDHCPLQGTSTRSCLDILVGSCNGLLCSMLKCGVYLLNPITKKCKFISDRQGIIYVGLGFDELRDDYKVVKFGRMPEEETIVVSVYSLRNDCWTRVGCWENWLYFMGPVCVNGSPHWLAINLNIIVFFDFTAEKLQVIKLAEPMNNCQRIRMLNGCIAVDVEREPGKKEVWVMKKYGVVESWSKAFDLEEDESVYWRLLAYTGDGKLVMEKGTLYEAAMVLYDPTTKTDTVWEESLQNVSCSVFPYMETLSPL